MSLETDLIESRLNAHLMLTQTIASLAKQEKESKLVASSLDSITKYSILFAYESKDDIPQIKEKLLRSISGMSKESQGLKHHFVDIICVLNQGLLLRDWENKGQYRGIITKEDTLMWFYILLLEYLDIEKEYKITLRDYVKNRKEYKEC